MPDERLLRDNLAAIRHFEGAVGEWGEELADCAPVKVAWLYSGLCTRTLVFGERAVWRTYLGEARRFVRESSRRLPAQPDVSRQVLVRLSWVSAQSDVLSPPFDRLRWFPAQPDVSRPCLVWLRWIPAQWDTRAIGSISWAAIHLVRLLTWQTSLSVNNS